ncbi:hypothetical protein [Eikenella corrodens]|uniref:hypothetical protein n=1 Tax=Eikenella corrodens TaxID=539 RepID=UPI00129B02A4|nr:hypothetical protein [Eikenella corrodens]
MKRLAMILALLPLAAAAQPTARQCRQINRDSIEIMTYLFACADNDSFALPKAAEQQADKLMQLSKPCFNRDQEAWWRQNGAQVEAERARYDTGADTETAAVCRQRRTHIQRILQRYR